MPGGELILCRLETPLQPENVFLDFGTGGGATLRQPAAGPDMGGERPREPVRTGGLFVETEPAGALVRAGGLDMQRSPFTFRGLPAGPLTVTVELAGHEAETRMVTIPADDFAKLDVTLKRSTGRVTVESDPPRAEIWLGSQRLGETPRTLTLETGSQTLTLRRDGYEEKTVTLQVRGGQTEDAGRVVMEVQRGPVAGRDWVSPATGMEFVWIEALKIWVGKYEVTNGEYRRKEAGHDSKSYENHSLNGDRQPVVYVNFDDAKAYAAWLTERVLAPHPSAHPALRAPPRRQWFGRGNVNGFRLVLSR